MKGNVKKALVVFGAVFASAVFVSSSAFAAPDESADTGNQYMDDVLMDEYIAPVIDDDSEYVNAVEDLRMIIADGDYEGAAAYVAGITNEELKVKVLDYLGIYYPNVYTVVMAGGKITIDVQYLGSFMGIDADGNPIEDDTSVALYNTMTAYKAGLISDITWVMTGREDSYTASLNGTILDGDDIEKTINGDGSVSFGLVVRGAYFAEDDEPDVTAEVTLNSPEN